MLTGRVSSSVISQSEVNAQGYPNGMHSFNISNVIWDSDSSDDALNTISQTPIVVKVVRLKSRKLVRKSMSKKLKRTSTNKNIQKKQKSLSPNMLLAEESSKIKTKATSRNQLVRQGTSKKWKNKKL